MTKIQILKLKKLCKELGLEYGEVAEEVRVDNRDFEIGDYRFIHENDIDKITADEIGDDVYMLGCFNADFIADNTDLSYDIVEALQQGGQYEALGNHIIDNDYLDDFVQAYISADGYGNHFGRYDGNEIDDILACLGYYVFRIN